jgi:hypothetical protein
MRADSCLLGTVVPTKSLFLAEVQRHELFEITFRIKSFVDDTIVSSALSILKLAPLSCETKIVLLIASMAQNTTATILLTDVIIRSRSLSHRISYKGLVRTSMTLFSPPVTYRDSCRGGLHPPMPFMLTGPISLESQATND